MALRCEKLVGTTAEVLVEGFDRIAECWYGRTFADAPEVDGCVFFTANGKTPVTGDFVKVKITDHLGIDPVGIMEN
jgi:ribosomal protein S12 methylthiotransferase